MCAFLADFDLIEVECGAIDEGASSASSVNGGFEHGLHDVSSLNCKMSKCVSKPPAFGRGNRAILL
jgi:hypothetical protein